MDLWLGFTVGMCSPVIFEAAPTSVALLCGAGQWALPRDPVGPQAGSEQVVHEHGRRVLGLFSSFHYSYVMMN